MFLYCAFLHLIYVGSLPWLGLSLYFFYVIECKSIYSYTTAVVYY